MTAKNMLTSANAAALRGGGDDCLPQGFRLGAAADAMSRSSRRPR